MLSLRDYQLKAKEDLREALRRGFRRPIIVAPTGAGKTIFAADLLASAKERGRDCQFIASKRELVNQCSRKLTSACIEHGLLMAGRPLSVDPIRVVSQQTFYSRVVKRKLMSPTHGDLILWDECHHAISRTARKIIELYPEAFICGLSATPCRSDGSGLGDIFDCMVRMGTYKGLIRDGYLVPTRVFVPDIPDLSHVKKTGGDYNVEQLAEVMGKAKIMGNSVKAWEDHAKGRLTLVFGVNIQHSKDLCEQFRSTGYNFIHIDSTMEQDEIDAAIAMLHHQQIDGLCNCFIAAEGFDCPAVSCIVNARPTTSLAQARQIPGRGQRPYEGKMDLVYLDQSGSIPRFGVHPDEDVEWTLEPGIKIQERLVEKMERDPPQYVCSDCGFLYTDSDHCPVCGCPRPMRRINLPRVAKGKLTELKKSQLRRKTTLAEKQEIWDKMLQRAVDDGYRAGYPLYKFIAVFGEPRGLKRIPKGGQKGMLASKFMQERAEI